MKLAVLSLFLIAGLALAADDADSKKLAMDLEGSYKVTAAERSGGPPPGGFLDMIDSVSIKGNKFTIVFKADGGKNEEHSATFTIDAAKKPAQIDLKPDDGEKKQVVQGIVALEDGALKICWADDKRPVEFKTSKDDKNMLLSLKKMK